MKIPPILLLLCFLFAPATMYAQNEVLTNKSISEMITLGFSEDVILTKIKTSKNDFDTSLEALKDLKNTGISDVVIMAIMNGSAKEEKEVDNKVGIYTKNNDELKKILPTVFSGTKTNTLASAFTYGIADASIKSTLNGSTSTNKILSSKPEFYFYFAKSKEDSFSVGASNWWFVSATSPTEFALVKLTSKKNKRELKTGKVNIYAGSEMGIGEEYSIPFKISQINEYAFKVEVDIPLYPGEYCFFYQGVIPQGGFTNQSVFDFSIPTEYGVNPKFQIENIAWVLKNEKPYYFRIKKVEVKSNGIYYTGENAAGREFVYEESECFQTKKDLLGFAPNI